MLIMQPSLNFNHRALFLCHKSLNVEISLHKNLHQNDMFLCKMVPSKKGTALINLNKNITQNADDKHFIKKRNKYKHLSLG